MIELVICVMRNESVAAEDFRQHWKHAQGQAVRDVMEILGATNVRQTLALEVERNQQIRERYRTAPAFDGIITFQFETPQNLLAKVGTPKVAARLMEIYQDQLPYIDLPRCSIFYTEEPVDLTVANPYRRDGLIGDYLVEEENGDGG